MPMLSKKKKKKKGKKEIRNTVPLQLSLHGDWHLWN